MNKALEHLDKLMNVEINRVKKKYAKLRDEENQTTAGKYKRKSIPKAVKDKVWDTYIGQHRGTGPCYTCECQIDSKKFDCGHIVAAAKGGENIVENLRPVCGTCNRSMGTQNMEEFKCMYFRKKRNWCFGFC